MRWAVIALALGGCLVVETTGDPPAFEIGLEYHCVWRHNGIARDENVCGPAADAAYVLERIESDATAPAHCDPTFTPCAFERDP